jgi:ketosteroid isomerase-like protein
VEVDIMKYFASHLRGAAFVTLVLIGATCVAQVTDGNPSPEALEQVWVRAVMRRDLTALDRILDASFVETLSSGVRRTKADVLAAAPPPSGSTQELQDLRVRTYGDTAIVTGVNRFRQSGQAEPVYFAFTDVFVRKHGDWCAVSSQMTFRGRE